VKYFRWAHTVCAGMKEDFVCETSWVNTVLFLVCILCICIVFNSVTILFKVPKEKTTMRFGENVYSKTNNAGYSRRETRCN